MESISAVIAEECLIEIPLHFGRYDYIRTIGQGSFSIVVLVADRSTCQQYACKICSRQFLITKNIFDRFEREVRIMQSFKHSSLVQLEDVVYDQNLIYLVMEYCMNGELFQVIADHGRLDEKVSQRIFTQIIDGMTYIHARDIAHRDLKPENILLDENLNAKITDFGLCHQVDERTLLRTPCGSPFYASPEIISNQPYDGKLSDIWSLGVVLYTMVTGTLPWQETNQIQLFQQIVDAKFIIPRSLTPHLRDLISRLMRPDPHDRPQVEEIGKHPWILYEDEDDQSKAVGRLRRKSDTSSLSAKAVSSLRRPLIVRPLVPQSAISSSSFNGTPEMANLIRRVPPSSGKKNQSSIVNKQSMTSSIVQAKRRSLVVETYFIHYLIINSVIIVHKYIYIYIYIYKYHLISIKHIQISGKYP